MVAGWVVGSVGVVTCLAAAVGCFCVRKYCSERSQVVNSQTQTLTPTFLFLTPSCFPSTSLALVNNNSNSLFLSLFPAISFSFCLRSCDVDALLAFARVNEC